MAGAWERLDAKTRREFRLRAVQMLASGMQKNEVVEDAAAHWDLRKSLSLKSEVRRLHEHLQRITG
jgi:hypothetical protein